MLDKVIKRGIIKSFKVLFEVSLGGLATITDGHSLVFVVVSRRTGFEDVSSGLIDGSDKEANTEGSLTVRSGLNLGLLGNFGDDSLARMLALMGVPVSEAFVAEELGEVTSISSHTGDNHTHVRVDLEDLLLMSGEIVDALFQSDENLDNEAKINIMNSWLMALRPVEITYDVLVGFEGNGTGSLLDGLFSVVNLQTK